MNNSGHTEDAAFNGCIFIQIFKTSWSEGWSCDEKTCLVVVVVSQLPGTSYLHEVPMGHETLCGCHTNIASAIWNKKI